MKNKMKRKGAILVEVALSISVNLIFLLGGLEIGWYLYVKSALAAATAQAAYSVNVNEAKNVMEACLLGLDLPQNLIDNCSVSFSNDPIPGGGGVKIKTATLSLPISEVLIFGNLAFLEPLTQQSQLVETASARDMPNQGQGQGNY